MPRPRGGAVTRAAAAGRVAWRRLALAALVAATGCREVERRWARDGELDAATVDDAADAAGEGRADVADAADADAAPDRAPTGGDAGVDGGCTDAEAAAIARALALFTQRVRSPSEPFTACLRHAVASPTTAADAEEVTARLGRVTIAQTTCTAARPGAVGHDLLTSTWSGDADTAVRGQLTFPRAALAQYSAERLAGAITHHALHGLGYGHWSGDRGENFYGVPEQGERCALLDLGAPLPAYMPAVQSRDRMLVESELQPFGNVLASANPPFFTECPAGQWATSLGHGDAPASFGLRCEAAAGDASTVGGGPGATWRACAAGLRVVGVRAVAGGAGVRAFVPLCASWDAARGGWSAAEATPTLPTPTASERVYERRCLPHQAASAVSGTFNVAGGVAQLALVCRDPTRTPPGPHRALPAIGVSPTDGERWRRHRRCGDQGVLTGVYGHRRPDTSYFSRFGGVCRGTEHVDGALRFRREPGGAEVPEHVIPGTGGIPTAAPAALPFDLVAGTEDHARCPSGMGVVGLRLRRGGALAVAQHLQGLCAPLDAWTMAAPPPPTRVTFVGEWTPPERADAEQGQCPAGSFVVGMEVFQRHIVGVNDVIERIALVCRDMRPAR